MSLRAKISLVILLDILATLALVGFLAFRQSKAEIEELARELLKARTEYAYTLCQRFYAMNGEPTDELAHAISRVKIGAEGYIFVFSTREAGRARLEIHPSAVGEYIESFEHIQRILADLSAGNSTDRMGDFITYTQGTDARGRQGAKKIGYWVYFAPWQWVLMSSSYESDLYGGTETVRKGIILAIALVGFVSLVVLNLFVIGMFRPMQQLIAATKQVSAGNLDVKIQNDSNDEIGRLAQHFNNMLRSLKENTRVWQELEIARRLQNEMLPDGHPKLPGVVIAAQSIPATEVGGDFYDFIPLDENRFAFIIGDVSGKGISGAIGMSSAISALRFAVDERETTDQILELANRRLVKDIQRHMFVAIFLGIYDRRAHILSYTNAGQTMPVLWRKGHAAFLPTSSADRFPVGIRHNVHYAEQGVDIRPGDILVCYTDGIIELADMSGKQYEPYGFERFCASIEAHVCNNLSEMLAGLIQDAETFVGSENHTDDVTLVIIKFN